MTNIPHKTANRMDTVSVYTFTGKEWCKSQWLAQRGPERGISETGFSYFGARYYDSDLSGLFLSVDPMADKYPSISPYAYCAWNPVKLIDPDGDSIRVLGEQSSEIIKQLQTNNMAVSIGQNGYLDVVLLGCDQPSLSDEEKVIYNAVTSDIINMTILAEASAITEQGEHYFILKDQNIKRKLRTVYGGSFCGAYKNNVSGKIDTYSFIDYNYMNVFGFDQGVVHEISENYYAGMSVLSSGKDIQYGNIEDKNQMLLDAHQRAIQERLEYGRTYKFGPQRGQLKLYRMKHLYEL